jgi:hypothetical protein
MFFPCTTLAFLPVVEEKFLVADLLRYPEGSPKPFFIGPVSEWDWEVVTLLCSLETVPESTSIVFSSSEHVSDEEPRQESLPSRRGSHSSAERYCRISEPSSYSRLLFPPFSCPKRIEPLIDLLVSILKCGTIKCWFRTERSITGLIFPFFFGTRNSRECQSIFIHSYLDDSLLKNMS